MKSGMLAAEAVVEALAGDRPAEPAGYEDRVRGSWLWEELSKVRNVRPAFAKFGLMGWFWLTARSIRFCCAGRLRGRSIIRMLITTL